MKKHLFLLSAFLLVSLLLNAQAPVYDDLVFEDDSLSNSYRPTGKYYVHVKAKKGSGGMEKVSSLDSIKSFPITDIVLVFTENDPGDIANRLTNNQERWENLLSTYPELFQFNTNYKNMCQCVAGGNMEVLKLSSGFYVYFQGKEPPKQEVVRTEEKKEEKKQEVKKEEAVAHKEEKKEEKKHEEKKQKEESKAEVKKEEVVKEEPKKEEVKEEHHEEVAETQHAQASSGNQKAKFTKPKRAKDPKACRPPFYENGDEDLVNFFVNGIELTKKQKRHGKSLTSTVTLMLNFDGTIKKSTVTGPDEVFNKQVTGVMNTMNAWNPAVKGGLTVKSQVKFILKYEKSKKGMIPTEINITPRPGPKCKIQTDSELFD